MGIFGGKPNVEKLKAKGDLKGLIQALNYGPDWRIRKAAAEALGQVGDPRAINLRYGGNTVNLNKYSGLLRIAAHDEVSAVGKAAARAIERIGKPALPVLIDELATDPMIIPDDKIMSVAAYLLGEMGDTQAIDALLDAQITAGNNAASEALIKFGGAAAQKICDKLLSRGALVWDGVDRHNAKPLFDILGHIGDQRAVDPLLRYIKEGESVASYPFKEEARLALEKIVKGKEVELFSAALTDRDWLTRVAATEELGKLNDPEAEEVLRKLLMDEVSEVREAAEKALDISSNKH